ncbi:MAG: SH3 domain-containing protein [Thermodesulfobacteriota bacterium]
MRPWQTVFFLFLLLFLLQSCVQRHEQRIPDLAELPQDPGCYLEQTPEASNALLDSQGQKQAAQDFLQQWSAPWRADSPPELEDFVDYARSLEGKRLFGENKRPRQAGWLQRQLYKSNLEGGPSLDQLGIASRNSSLRLLPTHRPAYRDFDLAGQGYPFDLLQISAIWAGTPVRILHESRDQAWYLVQSGFALGWMPVLDVAKLEQCTAEEYLQGGFLAVTRDEVPVLGRRGGYLGKAHLGSIFPLKQEQAHGFIALVPGRNEQGRAVLQEAFFSRAQAEVFPLRARPGKIAKLASGLMGQSYGWGGLYENRDCSAMLKDLFAPFGIWLPRNSKYQAKKGRVLELEGLSAAEKQSLIMEKGRPLQTLIYMPGHIMLYLGGHKGRPVVLHNMWGLRTQDFWGREGRKVVGRTVITTLQPGRGLPGLDRDQGDLLQRVKSMNILVPEAEQGQP